MLRCKSVVHSVVTSPETPAGVRGLGCIYFCVHKNCIYFLLWSATLVLVVVGWSLLTSILLKCHKHFAVSGFNLIREYINRDLLTDMWNTLLYHNYLVDVKLLGS